MEGKKQKARILCGIRASGIQSAAGVSVRHDGLPEGAILGHAMVGRLPQRDDAHERTTAGEGLGVAMGIPAVHDGCPGSFRSKRAARARVSVARFVQKNRRSSKRQDAV